MKGLRSVLTSRVVDPVVWGVIKRIPFHTFLSEFRRGQWDDTETFSKRQAERLSRILTHATTRVPFYMSSGKLISPDALRRDPLRALASFPILEKKDLRESLADLTCEMGRGTFRDSSGGSTGDPVTVVKDKVFLGASLAAAELFHEWTGVQRGERRVKLWGAARDLNAGTRIGRWLVEFVYNKRSLNAFEMSADTMRDYVERLSRFRPVCLEGYADALYGLAEFTLREGLSIPSPRAIISGASTLHPHMRGLIEDTFGASVFNRYGGREAGGMAGECDRHEGLHVFGEMVVLEVVDDSGREVQEGEEGDVLVTSLWNYTMPLIRYRIGDRAIKGPKRCSCGRSYPLLKRIAGRSGAPFPRPGGGVVVPVFFIHVIGVECNDGSIARFQVVQETMDRIVIRIVLNSGTKEISPLLQEQITARIRGAMGESCDVRFSIEDVIVPTPTGKYIHTVSLVEKERSGDA